MRWGRVAMAILVLMPMLTLAASPAVAQPENEATGGGALCQGGDGGGEEASLSAGFATTVAPATIHADGLLAQGSFEGHLRDYDFICAFLAPFLNNMSILILGLIAYGAIGTASFIRTGSPMIPYVLLLMVGGAIASQIAGPGIALITIVALSIIGGIPVIAYRYYRRV